MDTIFSSRHLATVALSWAILLVVGASIAAGEPRAGDYVPGEIVVGYLPGRVASVAEHFATRVGIRAAFTAAPNVEVLRLRRGVTVARTIAELRDQPGVAYAVANFIAHEAGAWIPNNPGRAHHPGGWEAMQWNFLSPAGVNAPQAWANLIAAHRPGGRGVTVAVLDTGVAYRNWRRFRKSPGFKGTRFVDPYDFVANNRYPLDREGHGTFIAGTVAEATNNGIGLTGLAYGTSIMPVRVLDASGSGDAATIAHAIRYAVTHGAQVINLSLEFDIGVGGADIPEIINAIAFANRRGVVVVAAAGNDSARQLAYPAADPGVISVGATTRDRCLADYSNVGRRLDLVAPGGGDDSGLITDSNCHPSRSLPNIYQMTLLDPANPRRFGYPDDYDGTSMSAAHVAAVAALVIASGVIGRHPRPEQVLHRLEQTAQPLGGSDPNDNYGYGLVDAGAATAPDAALSAAFAPRADLRDGSHNQHLLSAVPAHTNGLAVGRTSLMPGISVLSRGGAW